MPSLTTSISNHLQSRTTQLIILLVILSLLIFLTIPFTSLPGISLTLNTSSFITAAPSPGGPGPAVNGSGLKHEGSNFVGISISSSCDLYDGKWVYDESYPIYAPGSCSYVDAAFNCFKNGRSDLAYMSYRWQPHGCDLPRFDAKKMMEMLRGKRLVFVGDSLNRNMLVSLICSLKMFKNSKSSTKKGFISHKFEEYNCSIIFITAPFLVQHGELQQRETLRLDMMDASASNYHDAEFLIFNTGRWWNPNKVKNGVNYFQEGNVLHSKMEVGEAYEKAIHTWAKWVDENVNKNKTQVLFVGYSASHFGEKQWNSGGACDKEKEPIVDDKLLTPYPWLMRTFEHVISNMKTPILYMNLSKMTDYRKDAHPSIYRGSRTKRKNGIIVQDCMHWCLPGVPDSWNQLVYASLLLSSNVSSGNQ